MATLPVNQPDMKARLERVLVPPGMPISEAIDVLDRAGVGALLVVDDERRLLGVLTDGDFRRAILRRVPSDDPCGSIATKNPVVAPHTITPAEALDIMDHTRNFLVNQLSLVDDEGRVTGLLLRSDLVNSDDKGVHAMVMAGGFGMRLRPMTSDTPKPMLSTSYQPELLNLRTFPTLMGYSSRILAESWESNLLYYAALADDVHMAPAELNLRVPEWTQQTVERIFATHLDDWPALLRSLRLVGDEVREKARKQTLAESKAESKTVN